MGVPVSLECKCAVCRAIERAAVFSSKPKPGRFACDTLSPRDTVDILYLLHGMAATIFKPSGEASQFSDDC